MDNGNDHLDALAAPPLKDGGFTPELRRRIAERLTEQERRQAVPRRRWLSPPTAAAVCAVVLVTALWLMPDNGPTAELALTSSEPGAPAANLAELAPQPEPELRSGLLLGLRQDEPAAAGRPTEERPSESSYRTLWIAQSENGLDVRREGDKLLVPYRQDFWIVEPETAEVGDDVFHRLLANKAGEVRPEESASLREDPAAKVLYSEHIDFAGNQYVAITVNEQRADAVSKVKSERVKVERLDDVRSGREAPLALEPFISGASGEQSADTRSWTLLRESGNWAAYVDTRKTETEPLQLQPLVKSAELDVALTAFDQLCLPWERIAELQPDATDAVCSPSADLLAVFEAEQVSVYMLDEAADVYGQPLRIELRPNERMVMAQWAMDQYVDKWDELALELLN